MQVTTSKSSDESTSLKLSIDLQEISCPASWIRADWGGAVYTKDMYKWLVEMIKSQSHVLWIVWHLVLQGN